MQKEEIMGMNDNERLSKDVPAQKMDRRKFLKGTFLTGIAAIGVLIFPDKNRWADILGSVGQPQWQITVDDQVIKEGVFVAGVRKDLYLPVPNGTAHIVLDGGRIYVHEDNNICKKKICYLMGSITRSGESIICLPNQLVIRIL
jgi:hypothetical protein